jgi:hypothetical protein
VEYTINERWIKVSGKLPVPFNVEEDDEIICTLSLGSESHQYILNACKEEFPFNQDGSRDKVSVLKSLNE